jgi:hypothetical protein
VANLDASSAAFGLNAKSLIGIDEATSDQRLEISGQGPANAPSSGGSGGGSAGDPAYDFAASKVNIGLPTSLDDAGYAYLDDLNASGQLTVEEMALVQHQFYDQDIQLGTLGQLLLHEIARYGADFTHTPYEELFKKHGDRRTCYVRFWIWQMANERGLSMARIGGFFHRDHTTIMNGIRKARQLGLSVAYFEHGPAQRAKADPPIEVAA